MPASRFREADLANRNHRRSAVQFDYAETLVGIEALISWCVKASTVLVLGVPLLVVVAFEVALNATSTFNHGNVRIPLAVDARLRAILVTPDMHRVHHSRHAHEMNSNFGFNFPWWDHLFSTYRAQPDDGHETMELGIDRFRGAPELSLTRMLT